MNYYKRHIGDYLKDTAHLSLLEHGVYARLLDVYYTRESAIPDAQAARLIGARSEAEREAMQLVLEEFFELRDGAWIQHRCERELAEKEIKAETNRVNGKRGGRPKKVTEQEPKQAANGNPEKTVWVSAENPNGFQNETQAEPTENPSHKPLTNSHNTQEADASFVLPHARNGRDGVPVPTDIQPCRQTKARATVLGIDMDLERERFVAHYQSTGQLLQNAEAWQAKLRLWVLNQHQFNADRDKVTDAKVRAVQQSAGARHDDITSAADTLGVGSQYLTYTQQGARHAIEH